MSILADLLILALDIYVFFIIAQVILSWLVAFNVLNTAHPAARTIESFLLRVTEPVMAPVRRYIPSIGGIDLSPLVVVFGIYLLQALIGQLFG